MRGHVIFFTILLFIPSIVDGAIWQKASKGIDDPDIRMIISGRDNLIYAITIREIYKSKDGGKRWYRLKGPQGIESINTIHLMERSGSILLGTNKGLFIKEDPGWKRVYTPRDDGTYGVLSIDSDPERIYLGLWNGIVILDKEDNKWREANYYRTESPVYSIAIDKHKREIVYAASLNGLYRSIDSGKNWNRIFNLDFNAEIETPSDEIEEALLSERIPKVITSPFISGMVFVITPTGVFTSKDRGDTWKPLSKIGLQSTRIRNCIISDSHTLYAATDRGLFRYSLKNDQWYDESGGIPTINIRTLEITKDRTEQGYRLIIGTSRGIFISKNLPPKSQHNMDKRVKEILSMFSKEPSIEEIREAAIRYAEVHPEKIRKWRRAASRRAWLPTIRFEYQRGHDWESSTYFYSTTTQKYKDDDITKGRDSEWSISLTWDLGDLIWNSDQTSIDVRSRLMVKLRDEILNEVTHLYYERRRLQIELLLDPPDNLKERIEKELRLQELTAEIDALTGSYLSKRLLNSRSSLPHQ